MSGLVRGWHFVGDTLRDGRPVPPDGEWLVHDGPVEMCVSGLHGSLDPFDALGYAPGSVLCWDDFADIEDRGKDKLVSRRRRIVTRRDMTAVLRAYARDEASRALHLWDAPDVVRQWLATGDKSLRSAAEAAAQAAAWAAAQAAARAAAWSAAEAAAWSAAWSAARSAAWAAAWSAARSAAWAAARSAAWSAAWSAAEAASRQRFHALVAREFGIAEHEVVS